MRRTVSSFDIVVAKWIGRLPKPWYDVFVLIGAVIRPLFWIIVGIVAVVYCVVNDLSSSAVALTITTAFIFLSAGLKFIFRRDRPVTIYTENMRIRSYSFPSSHSYAAAVGTAMVVYMLAITTPTLLPYMVPVLFSVALTVGVSRIYVGAHYPSDVVGGLLLGWTVAGIILGVFAI